MPLIGSSKFVFAAQAKRGASQRAVKPASSGRLGSLPEWNLDDLYGGIDDPQVKRDLDRADAESVAFEQAYKGKLAALAERVRRRARGSWKR